MFYQSGASWRIFDDNSADNSAHSSAHNSAQFSCWRPLGRTNRKLYNMPPNKPNILKHLLLRLSRVAKIIHFVICFQTNQALSSISCWAFVVSKLAKFWYFIFYLAFSSISCRPSLSSTNYEVYHLQNAADNTWYFQTSQAEPLGCPAAHFVICFNIDEAFSSISWRHSLGGAKMSNISCWTKDWQLCIETWWKKLKDPLKI